MTRKYRIGARDERCGRSLEDTGHLHRDVRLHSLASPGVPIPTFVCLRSICASLHIDSDNGNKDDPNIEEVQTLLLRETLRGELWDQSVRHPVLLKRIIISRRLSRCRV